VVNQRQVFEALVLPHLDAAYNLARWLLRSDHAAQDAVQDAALRAFRYLDSLRGAEARPWLLGIVRNTCFTHLERGRNEAAAVDFDEEEFATALAATTDATSPEPSTELQRREARREIDAAIRALSPPLREVIVLREFEELEYAEIARIAGVPIGTVMSRLSRAREKLRAILSPTHSGDAK
jgi:RNA polymerase sigma factor (sigma-70 family)